MKVIKIYVTVTLSYNYLRHFTSVCFFFIWFKFALYLILDNLSCYAIVFRTRVTCSFSKQFAYSTRSVESLRPAAFARCNFAVACGRISTRMRRAMRCDATRRDGTRRGAPIKPVRNEFPISRPFPFSTNSRARCIYVSIPCVRFGSDCGGGDGNGGGGRHHRAI